MKAIPTIAAAVLILGTLPAAADSEGEERKARHEEARAALLDDLGLEGDQRTQVEKILEAHAEKSRELATAHGESEFESREQRRQSRREAQDQRQTLREETQAELKEILGDEQFARLQELRKERRRGLRQERGGNHHADGFSAGGKGRGGKGGGKRGHGRSHH